MIVLMEFNVMIENLLVGGGGPAISLWNGSLFLW